MPKYEVILFDFDGTLVDSNPAIYEAYRATFMHFYPDKDYSHIENLMTLNLGYKNTFKAIFYTNDIDQAIDNYLQSIYLKIASSQTQLFDGVHETIQLLENNAYPWGIVTSKKRNFVEQIITATGLSKGYACLICEEDIRYQKPNPESLLQACSLLDKNPEKVIYVGDALTDIQAARACGMDSIAVSYGYGNNSAEPISTWGANYIISEFKKLVPIILNSALVFTPADFSSKTNIKMKENNTAEFKP